MYHTKKIGIFISHIFGEYQRNLCQGVTDRAVEYGYTTEIFTSTDGEDLGFYAQGEHSILRIPNFSQFSGVIFASETYLQQDLRAQIAETLKTECTCPVLEIAQSDQHFPFLMLDNDCCVTKLTTHLIETHHCRRICYLGNELETYFSDHRRVLYQQVLTDHDMTCSDHDTCDCSYDRSSIAAGLEFLLQDGQVPDAIICYNDRMAVILMELLFEKGLRIPEDVCVTGFDDLEIGRTTLPDLTTVSFPLHEVGVKAFDLILDASLKKMPLPVSTRVEADPIYRGSCCVQNQNAKRHSLSFKNMLMHSLREQENSMLEDIKLSTELHSITDLEEGMDLLENYVREIEDCTGFYICLYPDWNHMSGHIRQITSLPDDYDDTDTLLMPFAYQNGKRMPGCSFTKKNTLPDFLYAKTNYCSIYAPLFFGSRAFGYAAFSFRNNRISARFDLLTFLRNINTLLKHIHDCQQTDLLVNRLEDVYGRDDLTNLPNRQGFRQASRPLINQAAAENGQILAMQFFLTNNAEIISLYGRVERDFAICVTGHALESAVSERDCISHQGGGEFLLLTRYESERQTADIENRLQNYLKNYNRLHTKPYEIAVATNSRIVSVTASDELEDLFP